MFELATSSVAVALLCPSLLNSMFLFLLALPFLRHTAVLLYPFALLAIIYIVSLSLSWNITQTLVDFYKYRVL